MKTAHREYQRLRGAVSRDPQLSNLPGLSQYQAKKQSVNFSIPVAIISIHILQAQAASLAGHLTADALLFPLETVLHRLHLQVSLLAFQQLLCSRARGASLTTWTLAGRLCPSSPDMREWPIASPQFFRWPPSYILTCL